MVCKHTLSTLSWPCKASFQVRPRGNQNVTNTWWPLSVVDHANIRTLWREPQSVSLVAWCHVCNICHCLCRSWIANYRRYALWSFLLLVACGFRRENRVWGISCSGRLSIGNISVQVGDYKYLFSFTTKHVCGWDLQWHKYVEQFFPASISYKWGALP